ncbi:MAG TPA: glycine cleavage T C-terminal barrel domain-containing protein [Pyrinomonadaceae bacterium]|nr:glycine cleavage T C-terminal barrel domain-containing protein [Pyrinomonadaceae bacterium]
MDTNDEKAYFHIRDGGSGYYVQKRGLIAVWGKEAVQFLDGLITNDMKTLEDGQQMLAAFPNAQGRLLAVVRVIRDGDRFLFETEEATREKVFQNLFRFTFAGDFFVEDLSDEFQCFDVFQSEPPTIASGLIFAGNTHWASFVPNDDVAKFEQETVDSGAILVSEALYEILRIESGIPKFGVDMDETTIVPELGIEEMISYKKGCYIGQEIIARIHFRGHVAKRLTGLTLSADIEQNSELLTKDGKNAGRVTSVTYSPKLKRFIALAYVRYDYLSEGTELLAGGEAAVDAVVTKLPFV